MLLSIRHMVPIFQLVSFLSAVAAKLETFQRAGAPTGMIVRGVYTHPTVVAGEQALQVSCNALKSLRDLLDER